MENLKGKTAFVTGGSKGIGYGIAQKLLANGLNVVLTSRSQESADKAAESLNKEFNTNAALGVAADVRNYTDQVNAVEKAVEAFGGIDVMVANAGLGHFGNIADISIEQWNDVIDTNLTGAFYSLKASLEPLKKSEGYYISISSLAGTNFFAGGTAYNASKFGVTGFTQAAMLDVRQSGIKVSTIMPGTVSSYFNGNEPDASGDWKIQPEDIGELVVDLIKMNPRTLPSKIEVRPSMPPTK
ncbi:short chain dehydrogenase [unidentified eubacterium SCB49]|nr:short chain dehydrogenase [unidentified eubacterium SCB49]